MATRRCDKSMMSDELDTGHAAFGVVKKRHQSIIGCKQKLSTAATQHSKTKFICPWVEFSSTYSQHVLSID